MVIGEVSLMTGVATGVNPDTIDPNNPEYSGWEYRIVFSVDVNENYKVINIINWFLKSTQFISY